MKKGSVPLTSQRIEQMARGFQASRIILTAYEYKLFTQLAGTAMTSRHIAERLGTDPRATDRLMNALVSLGLLEKDGEQFRNSPAAEETLVEGKPGYMSGLGHAVNLWNSWSTLTEAVKQGHSVIQSDIGKRDAEWLSNFIAAMHAGAVGRTEEVASLLDLSQAKRILDVGGGSGAYAMEFLRHAPSEARATVFDLPDVLPLTRQYVEQAGMEDRIDLVSGDYRTDELGAGFDLIFLSSIVHIQSDPENRELISKAARALTPGGQVVVKDFIVDEDRTSPPFAALFALNMLVGTESGDTFTESEVRRWMEEAGLKEISRLDTTFHSTLMIGRKPPAS